jgi:hypothetical protein
VAQCTPSVILLDELVGVNGFGAYGYWEGTDQNFGIMAA